MIRLIANGSNPPAAPPVSATSAAASEQPAATGPEVVHLSSAAPMTVAKAQSLAADSGESAPLASPSARVDGKVRVDPPTERTEDRDWSTGARAAAIVAGVVGGAAVATAVATLCAVGGMQLGGVVMGSLYQEALPRAIGLAGLANASNLVLLGAPVAGGVAGGIVGGIAGLKKSEKPMASVPGSELASRMKARGGNPLKAVGYVWDAVKDEMRPAGVQVHEGINGVGQADSLLGAMKSGGSAGFAFARSAGSVGGRLIGIAQGAYLGALLAGMPFAFAPLTAIPVAIVGAWGISNAYSRLGGLAAGAVAAAGGAAVGGAAYGVKQAAEAIGGHHG